MLDCEPLLSGIRERHQNHFGPAGNAEGGKGILEVAMRAEYDFSKSRKNPYAKRLRRQVTIRLDTLTVDYFKQLAAEMGMPYQNLINLFLRECAQQKLRPAIQWPTAAKRRAGAGYVRK